MLKPTAAVPAALPTWPATPALRQVRSQTGEFGVRGKWLAAPRAGTDLAWNLSAFRTQLHDDIYGIATSVSSGFFQNIGHTQRQGLEAGRPTRLCAGQRLLTTVH